MKVFYAPFSLQEKQTLQKSDSKCVHFDELYLQILTNFEV